MSLISISILENLLTPPKLDYCDMCQHPKYYSYELDFDRSAPPFCMIFTAADLIAYGIRTILLLEIPASFESILILN